jgi:hypothetical protein
MRAGQQGALRRPSGNGRLIHAEDIDDGFQIEKRRRPQAITPGRSAGCRRHRF